MSQVNVTEQIRALREEAAAAGDTKMVDLCDLALSGPLGEDIRVDGAWEKCIQAINEAASQAD